jgi:glutamate synthase (NADPH/NADH) small chain
MARYIVDEAKRCLQCKNPGCTKGCPVATPIPEIIQLLLEGEVNKAGKMLFMNNPLSVVCSLVCSHEKQCEGNCILGRKSSPVQVSSIEHYISDYRLDVMSLKPEKKLQGNVGIIGSGPAGITIAFILAMKGYSVTMFEAHDKIGGIMRYGIPDFRLPKEVLDKLEEKLIQLGVVIRPNTLIGPVLTIEDLFNDGYDALFVGTGTWKPNRLGIKGESLGNVHFAIDYLKNPEVYHLGNKLCVIGAGNAAMDVARTAIRKGVKQVFVMYRKGMEDMTASQYELDYAKIDGVKFELYKTPLEFTPDGVIYMDTKLVEENGVMKLVNVEGSMKLFQCDSIIVAVSQGPKSNIVSTTTGLELAKNGLVLADKSGKTTKVGVFASGDVVTGARNVVEAVKHSKVVADSMHEYLSKKYSSVTEE